MKFYIKRLCRRRAGTAKILLVMKLIIVLLTTAIMQVSAASYGQRITLAEKNATLTQVFEKIKKQAQVDFVVSSDLLKTAKRIDVNVKNVELAEVLKTIFKNQPLDYSIEDKFVVVSKKEPGFLDNIIARAGGGRYQSIDVHGKVVDQNGAPLAGATIRAKEHKIVVTTKADGTFNLKGIDAGAMLEISFIGFVMHEVEAKEELGTIKLEETQNKLDAVQVQAYGITSRRFNTGNITTIKAAEIESQPVGNILQTLIGRVPGLAITQNSSVPGGGITIRMQGQNSIASGNDPLYIIDGVPYISQTLPTSNGSILSNSGPAPGAPAGTGNPLSYLNPADVESIDVLKDASATAIYGSRAANGAILITTKKGKAGNTTINLNMQNGWGEASHFVPMMNTQQYLEMRYEALKNDGITNPSASDYDINGLWDKTRYTDWQQLLLGGTAQYQNINGTVSGGSANTQFLIGGTYHRETPVFTKDFSDLKGSAHFNINNSSTNRKFKIQLTGNYLADNNQLPGFNPVGPAIYLAPDAPALYNADGSLNWAPTSAGTSSWTNPMSYFLQQYQNKTTNLIANSVLSYQILDGLDLKSSFGYNNLETKEFNCTPLEAIKPEQRRTRTAFATYSNSKIETWIIEPHLTYKRSFNNSVLDILIGGTAQQRASTGENLTALGFSNNNSLRDIASATSFYVNSSVNSKYKYNAIFGRINYNWGNKYVFDITGRRDGSSRFGSENQFHAFGSVGGAWIFSEEKSIKNNLPFLSFGKLKASFGTTGNDQIPDYQQLNLFSAINYGVSYQGGINLSETRLTNPYLQWEETKKLQFGLDLGFFKDRVLLTANYSRNRSSNQLIDYNLPSITGFFSVSRNFPATIQNTAFELTINSVNIHHKSFSWASYANLTLPQNELISFPNLESSTYNNLIYVGQPLGVRKAYHYLGVDPSTGKYQFQGTDGRPTTIPTDADRTVFINTSPKFYGGLGNSFKYKHIELEIFFQFVKQISSANYLYGQPWTSDQPGSKNINDPVTVLTRWQNLGDISSIQKFSSNTSLFTGYRNLQSSDAFFKDASFIRLKNASLSYQIINRPSDESFFNNIKIYLQGQNLLTMTKYKGIDPESISSAPLRYITVGIQLGLY